ncbi:MAG TPA: hypothetical protein DDW24_09260, partial [Blastocatellia bacterium]|nr:hypothetical protein [Blastocatellia bacterium]
AAQGIGRDPQETVKLTNLSIEWTSLLATTAPLSAVNVRLGETYGLWPSFLIGMAEARRFSISRTARKAGGTL